eukprot:scaffold159858_cov31-Tisochrysis_lutea.AAC.1
MEVYTRASPPSAHSKLSTPAMGSVAGPPVAQSTTMSCHCSAPVTSRRIRGDRQAHPDQGGHAHCRRARAGDRRGVDRGAAASVCSTPTRHVSRARSGGLQAARPQAHHTASSEASRLVQGRVRRTHPLVRAAGACWHSQASPGAPTRPSSPLVPTRQLQPAEEARDQRQVAARP